MEISSWEWRPNLGEEAGFSKQSPSHLGGSPQPFLELGGLRHCTPWQPSQQLPPQPVQDPQSPQCPGGCRKHGWRQGDRDMDTGTYPLALSR